MKQQKQQVGPMMMQPMRSLAMWILLMSISTYVDVPPTMQKSLSVQSLEVTELILTKPKEDVMDDLLLIMSPLTESTFSKIEEFVHTRKGRLRVAIMSDTFRCDIVGIDFVDVCTILGCYTTNPPTISTSDNMKYDIVKECGNIFPNNFNQYATDVTEHFYRDRATNSFLVTPQLLTIRLMQLLITKEMSTTTEDRSIETNIYPTQLMKSKKAHNPVLHLWDTNKNLGLSSLPASEMYPKLSLAGQYYAHWALSKGANALMEPIFDFMVVYDALMHKEMDQLKRIPIETSDDVVSGRKWIHRRNTNTLDKYPVFAMAPTSESQWMDYLHKYETALQSLVHGTFSEDFQHQVWNRVIIIQDYPDGDNVIALDYLKNHLKSKEKPILIAVSQPVFPFAERMTKQSPLNEKATMCVVPFNPTKFSFAPPATLGSEWPTFKPLLSPYLGLENEEWRILDRVASDNEAQLIHQFFSKHYSSQWNVELGGYPEVNALNVALFPAQSISNQQTKKRELLFEYVRDNIWPNPMENHSITQQFELLECSTSD